MQDLSLSLIQSSTHWHNADANLAMFEEKIWALEEKVDIILLPEMFTTGFSMDVEQLAEPMNFKTQRWMVQMATQTGSVIAGSVIIKDKKHFYNRLLWVQPDGSVQHYDKRHLFRMADEHGPFDGGTDRLIIDYKGWKICPLICYDLRFPVWARNQHQGDGQLDYDLLLYIANWPAARVGAWDILLQARAVENHCYVAGLNRTGEDGKGIHYNGHSKVVDAKGQHLLDLGEADTAGTVTLSGKDLLAYREKFPAWMDGDRFTIQH